MPNQSFLVVTNNYRASGGGGFPGCDGTNVVIEVPDANRDVVLKYVASKTEIAPRATGAWRLAPWPNDGARDLSDFARRRRASAAARPEADPDRPDGGRFSEAEGRELMNEGGFAGQIPPCAWPSETGRGLPFSSMAT